MLTANASSDRLERLFNIFVFFFPQNLVHDCITAARTSGNTPNLAIDTSIYFVVHSTEASFLQVWELYHIKQKRILREIFTSPVVLSWKEVQNVIMKPLTARRHDLFQVGISMSVSLYKIFSTKQWNFHFSGKTFIIEESEETYRTMHGLYSKFPCRF